LIEGKNIDEKCQKRKMNTLLPLSLSNQTPKTPFFSSPNFLLSKKFLSSIPPLFLTRSFKIEEEYANIHKANSITR